VSSVFQLGRQRRAAPEGGGQQTYPRPPVARAAAHLRSEAERWGGLSPRRRRCEAGALARVKAATRKDAVCDRAGRRSDGQHQDTNTALGCERRAARSLGWRSRSAAPGRVSAVHRSWSGLSVHGLCHRRGVATPDLLPGARRDLPGRTVRSAARGDVPKAHLRAAARSERPGGAARRAAAGHRFLNADH
jgi:hypothetical protein